MSYRYLRSLASLALALMLAIAGFAPAMAAAPANDTFPNATSASIGFSEVLNTTEATTDADDAQLNASCGAPATDASVWYVLQGGDQGVIVDVSQSNYSAGVLVGTGTQGNLTTVACGPGTVAFFAAAGTTYYILAIDDQNDGSGNGGSLSISFTEVPPPPVIDFTVNKFGQFNSKTGAATISGTYTCTGGDFIDMFVDARQRVGRGYVLGSGEFFEFGTCDGTAHNWAADIFPSIGRFAGGKTMTLTFSFACGPFQCSEGFAEQVVQLSGRKK